MKSDSEVEVAFYIPLDELKEQAWMVVPKTNHITEEVMDSED